MKRLTIGASLVIFGALAVSAAANFPYVDPLNLRYSLTTPTPISSFDTATVVSPIDDGMLANENVAVIECSVANLTAIDESDWAEESATVTTPQAALSLKSVNDDMVWMGYFGGTVGWQPLTGTATEGSYQLKIEIDYTLATKKVRYSVKLSGGPWTVLTYNNQEWNELGDTARKVASIDLYGYGTVNSASGECGDRATLTTVATSEAVDMNYSNLVVKASAKDVWGADKMTVTLKNGSGETVQTQVISNLQTGDHDYEVTFDKAQAGEQYTYDVTFGYPTGVHTDVVKGNGTAKLFSEIDWFGFDAGAFTNAIPEPGKIAIDTTKGTFASVDDEPGLITPMTASSENAKTVVETVMTISSVYTWEELPDVTDTQLSIALVENEGSTGRTWAYKVGSAAWVPITSNISTESGVYTVKVEFDYASAPKQATVWVKKGDAAYAVLKDQIALTANKLNTAAVMGGDVNAMNAGFKTTKPAEVLPDETKKEIAVNSNTEVDLEKLKGGTYTLTGATDKFHLRWKDGADKWAKIENGQLVTQSGAPANGLDSYLSYVLGLNAAEATSKPEAVVKPAQNQSEGIKLYVPNVSNLPKSGYKVMFQVQKKGDGGAWQDVGTAVNAGTDEAVSIPYVEGCQLYHVNTILK